MRLVQLLVPDSQRADVLDVLDEMRLDYVQVPEGEDGDRVVYFPLPEEGVQEVLDDVRDVGLNVDAYSVIVEADSATTEHIDDVRERFAESGSETLSFPELRQRAEDLSPRRSTFLSMAVASTVIATAGLLRNSAAAVAGAMVIAPFFGTALSVGTGLAAGDRRLLRKGLVYQVMGSLFAIASAALLGWSVRTFGFMPDGVRITTIGQVSIFLAPSALSVAIALAAGAAGAFAVGTAVAVPLAGVAIAAAIIPSAAVVGIGIAWTLPAVVVGALLQLGINIVGVNVASVLTLGGLGYWPMNLSDLHPFQDLSRRETFLAVVLSVAVVIASTAVVGGTAQHISFERDVNDAVEEVLDRQRYDALAIKSVAAPYGGPMVSAKASTLTVTVFRSDDRQYSSLPREIEQEVERSTGREVEVSVRLLDHVGNRPSD